MAIENDTIRLLRECDAGVKMGVSAIDDVLKHVSHSEFEKSLTYSMNEHSKLEKEIENLLNKYGDDGKEPNPMARGMSWIKTNTQIMTQKSDETIADLITDGCNMGVKSLNKYLNEYKAADDKSRDITKRLIDLEKDLLCTAEKYL